MSELFSELQAALGGSLELGRELGGGGMSRVFTARDPRLDRTVVVKVLAPELSVGVNADRFEREIRLAASLQHPNIVPLLSAGEVGGIPYYVMPFVEGASLRERVAAGPLPITETVSILRDIARALGYAHQRQVVHRDIKPDNVLLNRGAAVVTDFGIAKAISASRTQAEPSATGALTMAGTSLGTPAYMAPEQIAGESVDARADVYAFGCLAYELLTGRQPFADLPQAKLLAAHLQQPVVPVVQLRADVPPSLAALVMRCLAKGAAERPADGDALVLELDGASSSSSLAAVGRPPTSPAVAAAIFLAATAAVWVLTKAAIVAIGLPSWALSAALGVMLAGAPLVALSTYGQRLAARQASRTPTLTPGGTVQAAPAGTMATMALKIAPRLGYGRLARGGAMALSALVLIIAAALTARSAGVGPFATLLSSGKLAADDRLLLAEFAATGPDSTLGGVVGEALRTALQRSEVVRFVPTATVTSILERMQRPANTHLDSALALDVARRGNVKAILNGRVTAAGGGYIVTARLTEAATGDELLAFRETAKDLEALIPAVDRIARELRERVGESLRRVQQAPRLEEVTTSSFAALAKYTEARRANALLDYEKAMTLADEAVRLDTAFVVARSVKAVNAENLGLPTLFVDSLYHDAFRRRERLPQVERLLVEARYWRRFDRRKAIETIEALIALDSAAGLPLLNNLALSFVSTRQYDRAITTYERAFARDTSNQLVFINRTSALISSGRLDDAAKHADEAMRRFPSALRTRGAIMWTVWWNRRQFDSVAISAQAERNIGSAGQRVTAAARSALSAFVRGQLQRGAEATREWNDLQRSRGGNANPWDVPLTRINAELFPAERKDEMVRVLDSLLAANPIASMPERTRPIGGLVSAYYMAGRLDKAKAAFAALTANRKDTIAIRLSREDVRVAEAYLALGDGRFDEAIRLFRESDTGYDGLPSGCGICTSINLAQAFDLAGQRDSAIRYFEAFVTTPFSGRGNLDAVYLAGSYKRLGELYDAAGRKDRAIDYYSRFVDLWKDADPVLQPKVRAVRARLTELTSRRG